MRHCWSRVYPSPSERIRSVIHKFDRMYCVFMRQPDWINQKKSTLHKNFKHPKFKCRLNENWVSVGDVTFFHTAVVLKPYKFSRLSCCFNTHPFFLDYKTCLKLFAGFFHLNIFMLSNYWKIVYSDLGIQVWRIEVNPILNPYRSIHACNIASSAQTTWVYFGSFSVDRKVLPKIVFVFAP